MKINVFDIHPDKPRVLSLKGTEPFWKEILANLTEGDLVSALPRAPEISAELELTRQGTAVTVEGSARAVLHAPCSRCLVMVETHLDPVFSLILLPDPTSDTKEADRMLGPDELDDFTYRNDEIDVAALLNEQVLLEKPYKILCTEDCKGLCPACGSNLNDAPCGCPAQPKSLAFRALADVKLKD